MTHSQPLWAPLLLLLASGALSCPDCSSWAGTPGDICGLDGVTYTSECELLIALCKEGTITFGDGTDINSLPVSIIVSQYKTNDGPCSNDGGGGNCPNCTTVTGAVTVCDTSLTEFNSSCAMAKKMCGEGIISFDDGVDFSTMTESDYRSKVASYVYWNGKCTGPCPTGQYSNDGQYGPCRQCGPGEFTNTTGSTSCQQCPRDSYQPSPGSSTCVSCPNGTDTIDKGATSSSQCLSDCVAGHYSSTGKAPCTPCSAGTWTSVVGSASCQTCGVGNYTDGTMCEGCPMGTFSNSSGVTTCDSCPVGTFSNVTGSLQCTSCHPGTYMSTVGSPACRMCGEGTFNNDTGSTSCQKCDAGTYQIELGKNFCYTCPRGTYQPQTGAKICQKCAKGYYRETDGGLSCSKCPDKMTTDSQGSISSSECHFTSCDPGSKVVIVNGHVTCVACPLGTYQNKLNQTSCTSCPYDTYQDTESSVSCVQCPENSITYTDKATDLQDCEGPEITIATGKGFSGSTSVIYDKRTQLASNLRGKISSFKVNRGDWYIFSGTRYGGKKIRLNEGTTRTDVTSSGQYPKISGLGRGSFYSIRPVVTNVMCYNEKGLYYTGYRSKTQKGVVCQNWRSSYPHSNINTYSGEGIGNHNYCRNPDNDPNGPWCYTTDRNRKWDYCGVPKCKWNVECYTERGELYRGDRTKTAGNSYNCNDWYSNWPHPHGYDDASNIKRYGVGHHRFCRNPSPGDDNRPWCFTTYFFKRWSYCDVSKCEFSSTSYYTRTHNPKSG